MDIWQLVLEQWHQQSLGELFAVLFAITYVWLASEESIWCWPAGFISTLLYAYVFFDVTLVFQMLLNIYYMLMAVYGFITWRKSKGDKVYISKMSLSEHIFILAGGVALSLLAYLVAVLWFSYTLLILDVTVTIFSLVATYLTVKKRLECWFYWSFINLATIFLYLETELFLSIILMFIYIILAVRGLFIWHNNFCQQEVAEQYNGS